MSAWLLTLTFPVPLGFRKDLGRWGFCLGERAGLPATDPWVEKQGLTGICPMGWGLVRPSVSLPFLPRHTSASHQTYPDHHPDLCRSLSNLCLKDNKPFHGRNAISSPSSLPSPFHSFSPLLSLPTPSLPSSPPSWD